MPKKSAKSQKAKSDSSKEETTQNTSIEIYFMPTYKGPSRFSEKQTPSQPERQK